MRFERLRARITCGITLAAIFAVAVILGAVIALRMINNDVIVDSFIETFEFKGITAKEISDGESVNAEIADELGKELRSRYDVKVTDEKLAKIMERLDVSGFLESYMDKYYDYVRETGHLPELETDEYTDLIDENKELIEYIVGVKLNSSYYRYQSRIVRQINRYNIKARQINEQYDDINSIRKALTSDITVGLLVCLEIVLIVGYFVTRYKLGRKVYMTFRMLTFCFMASGGALLIIRRVVLSMLDDSGSLFVAVLFKLLREISKVFDYVGAAYFGLGAVLAVIWLAMGYPSFRIYRRSKKEGRI
ncbi:MAG: hypothetical protein IJ571_00110 [Ruminococcus sp.]|nr:hypothetical protein [Ruminococcus sp.]